MKVKHFLVKVFFLTFFLFILLFVNKTVKAQEGSTEITPTPIGAIPCNRIEEVDLSLLKFKGPADDEDDPRWGCVDLFFTKVCVSDLVVFAERSAKHFLNQELLFDEILKFSVCPPGFVPSTINVNDPSCYCVSEAHVKLNRLSDILCVRYIGAGKDAKELLKETEFVGCADCFRNGGYWSGLGCIYFRDWKTFFEKNIFGFLLGLAGTIALFCIIYAAFQIQTSQGNPEKIRKGQELLTSCIMGLMLIIFSVFILKLIGVDILRIPEFGKQF